MTKATKNNGTFEALNTREGVRYIAKRESMEITLAPCDGYYLATLWLFDRPTVHADGFNAAHSLELLVKAASAISWDNENVVNEVMTLAKELYQFIKRPARETYNSRF